MTNRCVFACSYWPPVAPGGAEWSNVEWKRELEEAGWEVVVVHPGHTEEQGFWAHRTPWHHVRMMWRVWRAARSARFIMALSSGQFIAAWLASVLRRTGLVIVLRDLGGLCPLGACPLVGETACPATWARYRRVCGPAHGARWVPALLAWADMLLRHAIIRRQHVAVVSRGLACWYAGAGLLRSDYTLLPTEPPRDTSVSADAAMRARRHRALHFEDPFVLYAGKWSKGKGVDVLTRAMELVGSRAWLLTVGKGTTTGVIPQDELFALYRQAAVVVVPSIWPEPRSRVIVEALACGAKVIGTAVGGTPELLPPECLVPPNDPEALARKILEVVGT